MAELHGRVFRFPNSGRLAALLFIGLICCGAPHKAAAQSEAITVRDIERWASQLRKPSEEVRKKAFKKLCALPASALPAIHSRIKRSRRQLVPVEDGREALRNFRHATGSRRADDQVNIQSGILDALKVRRTRTMGRTAERVCIIRSLEKIGTVEAYTLIADVFGLSAKMWNWERKRIVDRVGLPLLPALINATGHAESAVRKWGSWGIDHLGMSELGASVNHDDKALVAEVLRAYARTRTMRAMPLVVSFVSSHDLAIREAARWGIEQYGRNSVWQLRIAYRNAFEEDASPDWGWRRTAKNLFARLDKERLRPVHEQLEKGLAALDGDDLATAQELFASVLAQAPLLERRVEMAEGYARFAEAAKQQGKTEEYERLLQRAAWLAPERAAQWNSELLYAESERLKARGIVDTELLRRTLQENPEHELAADELHDLTGEEVVAVVPELAEENAEGRGILYTLLAALLGILFARRRELNATLESFKEGFGSESLSRQAPAPVQVSEHIHSLSATLRSKLNIQSLQTLRERIDLPTLSNTLRAKFERVRPTIVDDDDEPEVNAPEEYLTTETKVSTVSLATKPMVADATWKQPPNEEWLLAAMNESSEPERSAVETTTLADLILQAGAMSPTTQESSPGTIKAP